MAYDLLIFVETDITGNKLEGLRQWERRSKKNLNIELYKDGIGLITYYEAGQQRVTYGTDFLFIESIDGCHTGENQSDINEICDLFNEEK